VPNHSARPDRPPDGFEQYQISSSRTEISLIEINAYSTGAPVTGEVDLGSSDVTLATIPRPCGPKITLRRSGLRVDAVPMSRQSLAESFVPPYIYFYFCKLDRCRRDLCWNFARRALRQRETIVSGGEINRMIADIRRDHLPAINLAHVDLAEGEQRPNNIAAASDDSRLNAPQTTPPSIPTASAPAPCMSESHCYHARRFR
jgi:hypothetical protein